ncbi:MAG: bifunctional [glutamate--ammonia ligase]-adenylyl-L-tyrosine phosphorylase/[glutamate--ammonia-ligase] adenylyltransferase [Pseudomonadota bacterium]
MADDSPQLTWLNACGPFLQSFAMREGIALETLADLPPTPIRAGPDLARELRVARQFEWARIAVRELSGVATVDETLHDLSQFADLACQAALKAAAAQLAMRYGTPRGPDGLPSRPIVLGMGKLGGRELNFSSDIDLIIAYTEPGETDGLSRISNEEYFVKLVQAFVKLLADRSEHGFVFRVDLMLRPFGSAGPVAMSAEAMLEYYQSHGRDWERYALIKARPVAGDLAAGEALLAQLTPFIYRRYLDFNAIAALRELKRKIAEDAAARRVAADDLKVGDGGIRECEFIVQSFQLVRGGQMPRLRCTSWRDTLERLVEYDYLPPESAASLSAAYRLLRRTENAVQMWNDEQTHALPSSPERREALALGLGFASYPIFSAVLAVNRALVAGIFQGVFAEPEPSSSSDAITAMATLWRSDEEGAAPDPAPATIAMLAAAGYGESAMAVVQATLALKRSSRCRNASPTALARLSALIPELGDAALRIATDEVQPAALPSLRQPAVTSAAGDPALAFTRALTVVEAVIGRSTYLTLLRESANARTQLLRLCAASPWLAEELARHPVLLDQLLDARALYNPPDRAALREGLLPRMAALPVADTEAAMDLLRRTVRECTLRIAAADIVHALPLPRVSDRLTWLAEAAVEAAVRFAERDLKARYGACRRADGGPAEFAVIGYGKLGALEMGYGSDIDLVFLHDADPPDVETSGGEKSLSQSAWMARLAQRVMHLLTTQTHLGRVYEVDIELRPNGNSGLPVVSTGAFADYQTHSAWTWEHQALSRARVVVGSPRIEALFESVRSRVLTVERKAETLTSEIRNMREKMRAHQHQPADGRWDIKQGAGGLIDVEFLVQHAVLSHAAEHPTVITHTDVWRQLEALEKAGCWPATTAYALLDVQREYRAWRHRTMLRGEPMDAPAELFAEQRALVTTLWQQLLPAEENLG